MRFVGGGFSLEEGFIYDGFVFYGFWIGRLYYNLLLNLDLGCLKCKYVYYIYVYYLCKFEVFFRIFYLIF